MKTLFILAAALACALPAAADDFAISPDAQWKPASDNGKPCYAADCNGSGGATIAIEKPLEPKTFYLLSWKMKGPKSESPCKASLYIDVGEKAAYSYALGAQWNPCYAYFNSGEAKKATLKMSLAGGIQGRAMAKDFAIKKIDSKDFSKNLLPDGNLELSKDVLSCWGSDSQQIAKGASVKISNSQDFLYGERMLLLSSDGPAVGARSIQLPVVPGLKYELRFWAKASCKTGIYANVQAWSPFGHQGKHFHKGANFVLGMDWKECSVKIEAPSKLDIYPDLRHGLMFIVIGAAKGDEPFSIEIDDVSFQTEAD